MSFPLGYRLHCGLGYQVNAPKPNHGFGRAYFTQERQTVGCSSEAISTTRTWSSDTGPAPADTVTTVWPLN